MKITVTMIALATLSLSAAGALAQSHTAANASTNLLRQDYITSTGQTVPHPGQSQSSGPTKLDDTITRENNRIERSICKGC